MNKKNVSKDLIEFGLRINESMDLNFVLEKIIEEKSLNLLSTKRATLYLLDDKHKYLIPKTSIDPNFKEQAMSEPIPVNSSLSGKVVNSKKGMIFNNTLQLPDSYKIPGTTDAEDENLMVIPLIFGKYVFGTINFYRDHIQFDEKELELANIFSMYASIAIQNALVNEKLNKEIEGRKRSEEKFRKFFNDNLAGAFISTPNGQLIDCNQAFIDLAGYPDKKTALSTNAKKLYEKGADRNMKIDRLRKHHKINQNEEEIIRFDGKKINVVSNVWGEYDKNGDLVFIQGYTRDITKIKQSEEELKASEQKYKNVIEHSSQMFYIHDNKHILSYVSQQCLDLFGYTPEEMMDRWTTFVTNNPINKEGIKITENTLNTGKIADPYLLEIKRKDGEKRLVKVFESPLKNESDKVIGIAGSLEDVTDFKKHEKELLEKNDKLELFATIFEKLNECITVTDKDHKIFYVNEAFKKLYGYKEEEYIGRTADFLRTDNDPVLLKEIKKNTNNGGWSGEIVNRKKDGSVFPIELSTTRIYDKEKNIVARIGIVKDITNRKRIETELSKEREKYRALVESSTDAIYIVDKKGVVKFVNSFGAKMLGKEIEKVVGKSVDKLFPKKIAENQKKYIKTVIESGKIARTESNIEFPSGKIWLENILIPVFNDEGEVTDTIGVSRDISEKKKYEMELEEHRSNLEKLVKERTEELEEKNQMLDSSVKVFVGREQTIIKLKNKLKDLEARLEAVK